MFAHVVHPAPHGRVHARHAHTSNNMWALAHTHEHRRAHIHYSSRTPTSFEYTQHIGRAPTRVTIAFTRHPTVAALKCRKSKIGRADLVCCAGIGATGYPRLANSLRHRAIALRHSSPTVRAHGRSRRSRCSMVENRSRRRPAPLSSVVPDSEHPAPVPVSNAFNHMKAPSFRTAK